MPTKRPNGRVLAALATMSLALSSCASDDVGGAAPTLIEPPASEPATRESADAVAVAANGETVDVVALDNTFRPDSVEVVAGTAIRWENRGRNDHDVLPADDTLTWGVDDSAFAPGDEYTVLFDTPGEYPYYCSIHGTKDVGMVGTIVVVAA